MEGVEPAITDTIICSGCGMEVPAGAECAICGHKEEPPDTQPMPAESAPPPNPNQDKIDRIQQAYDDGKISEEAYKLNMKKFNA